MGVAGCVSPQAPREPSPNGSVQPSEGKSGEDEPQTEVDARGEEPCGFPPGAQAHRAVVRVRVLVGKGGMPVDVEILGMEPHESAFAEAAAECVRRFPFRPATDESGELVQSWTPPFDVKFAR